MGRYGAEAMIAKSNFHSRSVFAGNLIAVEMRKLEVKFDKPIYVGVCIHMCSTYQKFACTNFTTSITDISRQMQDHVYRHG